MVLQMLLSVSSWASPSVTAYGRDNYIASGERYTSGKISLFILLRPRYLLYKPRTGHYNAVNNIPTHEP